MKLANLCRPKWVCFLLLVIGVVMVSYSCFLPKYENTEKKEQLEWDCLEGRIDRDTYYEEVGKLTTSKDQWMDLGSGLAVFSVVMLVFLFASRTTTWGDFQKLSTNKKPFYWIASNLALLLLIPGTLWYYSYRGARGDYSMFADSIGIPMYSETVTMLVLLIPLNLFLLLTLMRSQMPAQLLYWPKHHNARSVVWEVVFGLCLLVDVFFLVTSIIDGDHVSVIVNTFFVYVILSLRAGKLLFLDSLDNETVEEAPTQS